MPNKTKAALQGRQCQRIKLKPVQIITLIDQVKLTPPLAQFNKLTVHIEPLTQTNGIPAVTFYSIRGKAPVTGNSVSVIEGIPPVGVKGYPALSHTPTDLPVILNFPQWGKLHQASAYVPGDNHSTKIFVQFFESDFKLNEGLTKLPELVSLVTLMSPDTSPFKPQYAIDPAINTKITNHLLGTINLLLQPYAFGSMPRCCNSLRMMRFIQAASDSSPSCRCASSIKSRSSGSSRNWNGGLPRLSFLCVDTFSTPDVVCLCVITHYMHMNEKATPRSGGTLPRRLTKPLYEVTIMADIKSTQTRPKFTFLFLAIYPNGGRPTVLRTDADTEKEARLKIERTDFTLIFAAQIRTESPLHFHRIDLDSGRIEFMHQRYQASTEVRHV